jgi:starvation-inducible DNA-binding protein
VSLVGGLQQLLSDVVSFSHHTQGCHWNVEGPDFHQYHSMFAMIYEDVDGSIDPLAENIRKLRGYAPFTLTAFSSLRSLSDLEISTSPASMVVGLLGQNQQVLDKLNECFTMATAENQQGIADFLAGRIDMHQKWDWQLRAASTPV